MCFYFCLIIHYFGIENFLCPCQRIKGDGFSPWVEIMAISQVGLTNSRLDGGLRSMYTGPLPSTFYHLVTKIHDDTKSGRVYETRAIIHETGVLKTENWCHNMTWIFHGLNGLMLILHQGTDCPDKHRCIMWFYSYSREKMISLSSQQPGVCACVHSFKRSLGKHPLQCP